MDFLLFIDGLFNYNGLVVPVQNHFISRDSASGLDQRKADPLVDGIAVGEFGHAADLNAVFEYGSTVGAAVDLSKITSYETP